MVTLILIITLIIGVPADDHLIADRSPWSWSPWWWSLLIGHTDRDHHIDWDDGNIDHDDADDDGDGD